MNEELKIYLQEYNIVLNYYSIFSLIEYCFDENINYKEHKYRIHIFISIINKGIDINIEDKYSYFIIATPIRYLCNLLCQKNKKIKKYEYKALSLLLYKSNEHSKKGILEISIYHRSNILVSYLLKKNTSISLDDIISCIVLKGYVSIISNDCSIPENKIYSSKNITNEEFRRIFYSMKDRLFSLLKIVKYIKKKKEDNTYIDMTLKFPLISIYRKLCPYLIYEHNPSFWCTHKSNKRYLIILKQIITKILFKMDHYLKSSS